MIKIDISIGCKVPFYEQIINQILHAILASKLLPGDALPSLRLLAKELNISLLTINHAYTELEKNGYIENIHGKGCFVADGSAELIKLNLTNETACKIRQAVGQARKGGILDHEILTLFYQCLKEGKEK